MSSDNWHAAKDVNTIMDLLNGEVFDHKLRLFACACCRRIWHLIDTELHRRIVEFVESFARSAGRDVRWFGSGHWQNFRRSWSDNRFDAVPEWIEINKELDDYYAITELAWTYDHFSPREMASHTLTLGYDMAQFVAQGVAYLETAPYPYWLENRGPRISYQQEVKWHERAQLIMPELADLYREIYENPFATGQVETSWFTPEIAARADLIRIKKRFEELPKFADHLESVGCNDMELLGHFRSSTAHVVDCWALDRICNHGKSLDRHYDDHLNFGTRPTDLNDHNDVPW